MEKMLVFGAALHCPTTPKVSQMRPVASTHPIVIAKTYVAADSFLNYMVIPLRLETTSLYSLYYLYEGPMAPSEGVPWRYTCCGESTQEL